MAVSDPAAPADYSSAAPEDYSSAVPADSSPGPAYSSADPAVPSADPGIPSPDLQASGLPDHPWDSMNPSRDLQAAEPLRDSPDFLPLLFRRNSPATFPLQVHRSHFLQSPPAALPSQDPQSPFLQLNSPAVLPFSAHHPSFLHPNSPESSDLSLPWHSPLKQVVCQNFPELPPCVLPEDEVNVLLPPPPLDERSILRNSLCTRKSWAPVIVEPVR